MPWRECSPIDERQRFLNACRSRTFRFTDLRAFFAVSGKTGYKWVARLWADSPAGLQDRPRTPHSYVHRTPSRHRDGYPLHPPAASRLGPRHYVGSSSAGVPRAPSAGTQHRRRGPPPRRLPSPPMAMQPGWPRPRLEHATCASRSGDTSGGPGSAALDRVLRDNQRSRGFGRQSGSSTSSRSARMAR